MVVHEGGRTRRIWTMSMQIRQWIPAGGAGKVGAIAAALAVTVTLAGWNAMPVARDAAAFEQQRDNGKSLGVGQVVDNLLVIAYLNKGRTAISVMTINPDGSLSGSWFRRTDRG